MSTDRPKREAMSLEEATVSNMWEIAAIVEILTRTGLLPKERPSLVGGTIMSLRLVLFCWICLGVFVSGCGTTSQEDKKGYPRVGVIGHGTQRSGWLGAGVTIPFPGKSSSAPPSSAAGSGEAHPDSKR